VRASSRSLAAAAAAEAPEQEAPPAMGAAAKGAHTVAGERRAGVGDGTRVVRGTRAAAEKACAVRGGRGGRRKPRAPRRKEAERIRV
jgi:hypothetical protein